MDETSRELELTIEELLQKLIEGRQKTEDLLNLKNQTDRLNTFEAHVLEMMSAIMQVLENDEDMAAMYLTNAHRGCVFSSLHFTSLHFKFLHEHTQSFKQTDDFFTVSSFVYSFTHLYSLFLFCVFCVFLWSCV
jgi:hypothetical protein